MFREMKKNISENRVKFVENGIFNKNPSFLSFNPSNPPSPKKKKI